MVVHHVHDTDNYYCVVSSGIFDGTVGRIEGIDGQ